MSSPPIDIFKSFEEKINYRFSDRRLLEEALTHSSYLNETDEINVADNERLEFFGDSVLSLFVSCNLYQTFTEKREGELSRIRAAIVDEASLARSAVELSIGDLLRLGKGEERSGGRTKKSILADAFEALLGAVYLDGGADAVAPIVNRHYASRLADVDNVLTVRDCKSKFQESAQSLVGKAPTYKTIGTTGPDHTRIFTVAAFLGDEQMGTGSGKSKKEAEQEAACQGLEKLAERFGSI